MCLCASLSFPSLCVRVCVCVCVCVRDHTTSLVDRVFGIVEAVATGIALESLAAETINMTLEDMTSTGVYTLTLSLCVSMGTSLPYPLRVYVCVCVCVCVCVSRVWDFTTSLDC